MPLIHAKASQAYRRLVNGCGRRPETEDLIAESADVALRLGPLADCGLAGADEVSNLPDPVTHVHLAYKSNTGRSSTARAPSASSILATGG
jgi:hypothetical protein